jgi:hypothetical protein
MQTFLAVEDMQPTTGTSRRRDSIVGDERAAQQRRQGILAQVAVGGKSISGAAWLSYHLGACSPLRHQGRAIGGTPGLGGTQNGMQQLVEAGARLTTGLGGGEDVLRIRQAGTQVCESLSGEKIFALIVLRDLFHVDVEDTLRAKQSLRFQASSHHRGAVILSYLGHQLPPG